jgi:hypothetical protein
MEESMKWDININAGVVKIRANLNLEASTITIAEASKASADAWKSFRAGIVDIKDAAIVRLPKGITSERCQEIIDTIWEKSAQITLLLVRTKNGFLKAERTIEEVDEIKQGETFPSSIFQPELTT